MDNDDMGKDDLKSDKVYIILSIVVTFFTFFLIILDDYIFPKIAIYKVSRSNPTLKLACVQDYKKPNLRHSQNYWIIDNKSYSDNDISIYTATTLTIKHQFPIDINGKKLIQDIKENKKKCYLVSYVEVVNLGFYRKFYLYQYID